MTNLTVSGDDGDSRSLEFLRGAKDTEQKNCTECIGAHLIFTFRAVRGAPQIFLRGGTGRTSNFSLGRHGAQKNFAPRHPKKTLLRGDHVGVGDFRF